LYLSGYVSQVHTVHTGGPNSSVYLWIVVNICTREQQVHLLGILLFWVLRVLVRVLHVLWLLLLECMRPPNSWRWRDRQVLLHHYLYKAVDTALGVWLLFGMPAVVVPAKMVNNRITSNKSLTRL
jgi:hypothetical protein